MDRTTSIEDFIPHREPVSTGGIRAALADLDPSERWGGLTIPLPYTRRDNGTIDSIEVGPYGGTSDWMVYFGRTYGGDLGGFDITAQVGRFPGHMVILVVRALYSHLTTVGPQGRTDTVESDVLYALGLVHGPAAARPYAPLEPQS